MLHCNDTESIRIGYVKISEWQFVKRIQPKTPEGKVKPSEQDRENTATCSEKILAEVLAHDFTFTSLEFYATSSWTK